ncbi:centrosomal protein of 78 kDa isoform X2 [Thalassophryne amazonica]|uniref:centrosomal protein of 78 kDa isoform X2 n=1 Tax=Thalassophryne amazonica TaxID=390379 RepID=UPI0014722572|nr:centrosomal protein of 78 kDa isoform X2 [Thalassophryne amazonica]
MVQDYSWIRRRGSQDFMAYYDLACARQELVPLPAVKVKLAQGILDFNGDRVQLTDWPPILSSISINKHLHHIAIRSTFKASLASGVADRRNYGCGFKKVSPVRTKDMTFKLCKALRDCLTVSPNLKTLLLNGLPLRERDLITLTKGLAESVSLENLSLANCPISDDGLEVICQSVKYSTRIKTVDFTGCGLTWRGAEHMANIIKLQGMQRHGTAWADSLRYRQPQFEVMGGLRRITLNSNTLIGDRGAAAFARELAEDLWVKAVDLQRCGVSSEGACRLLEALKTNTTLCVLDIRNNPLVDTVLIKTIIEKVLMNGDSQSMEYGWIKPSLPVPQRVAGPKRRAVLSAVKAKPRRGPNSQIAPQKKLYSHCRHVPWRAAARAAAHAAAHAERQRGVSLRVAVDQKSIQSETSVKVTVESGSEEEEEEVLKLKPRSSSVGIPDRIPESLQMELKECQLMLAEERRARLKAESRLIMSEVEIDRLRNMNRSLSEALAAAGCASTAVASSLLEDEAVAKVIESSFTKFRALLELLEVAGLGQLASIAGIEKSDFHPLGRPQLSSTLGKVLHDPGSLSGSRRAVCQDVQATTDSSPLISGTLSAPTHGVVDIFTSRSPLPVRAFLHEDRTLDVPFKQAAGLKINPCVENKEEPDQYSKPDTQQYTRSECHFHRQKPFCNVSLNKTFQTQQSHQKSKSKSRQSYSNSHHRDGSHGYSFSDSGIHNHPCSHASPSKVSRGNLSLLSGVVDVMSKKVMSEEPGVSKRKDGTRPVTAGQSESQGQEETVSTEKRDWSRSGSREV